MRSISCLLNWYARTAWLMTLTLRRFGSAMPLARARSHKILWSAMAWGAFYFSSRRVENMQKNARDKR